MPTAKLAALLNRVKRLTRAPGAKSALARTLSVPRQRVTHWINEHKSPSAEDALRLLEWVTAAEAQQKKRPARVSARAGQKARKKPNNEKQKPARLRRKK
jgi:plasmid maintenance system antidote protein VapI